MYEFTAFVHRERSNISLAGLSTERNYPQSHYFDVRFSPEEFKRSPFITVNFKVAGSILRVSLFNPNSNQPNLCVHIKDFGNLALVNIPDYGPQVSSFRFVGKLQL